MDAYLLMLVGYCAGVQQAVDIFKAYLDRSQASIADETRTLLLLLAKVIAAAVAVVPTYVAIPFRTGTWLDSYPVVLVAVSVVLVAAGSQFIYHVLKIVKAVSTALPRPMTFTASAIRTSDLEPLRADPPAHG